jgi:basic membrane lipoprotein Med (substrate-binding protein (PBP1-ABC) superfamily)
MTRSNRIGFIGGMELPPIVRGYQGWLQGARAINPAVDSRIAYLNTFDDVAAGREAALAMIRLGVDVLHHNADQAALGLFQAVKENPGVYAIGANADQTALAPASVIGSVILDLPRAFLAVTREVREARFVPRVEAFGLAGGVTRWEVNPALADRIAPEVQAAVRAAADSIIAGTLLPLRQ